MKKGQGADGLCQLIESGWVRLVRLMWCVQLFHWHIKQDWAGTYVGETRLESHTYAEFGLTESFYEIVGARWG